MGQYRIGAVDFEEQLEHGLGRNATNTDIWSMAVYCEEEPHVEEDPLLPHEGLVSQNPNWMKRWLVGSSLKTEGYHQNIKKLAALIHSSYNAYVQ